MFENLAKGDKVAVYGGYRGSLAQCTVAHVTADTFQVDGSTYSRKNGERYGSSYACAEPWTQDHDERLARVKTEREERKLRHRLSDLPWRTMDIAKVKAAIEALEAAGVLPAEEPK